MRCHWWWYRRDSTQNTHTSHKSIFMIAIKCHVLKHTSIILHCNGIPEYLMSRSRRHRRRRPCPFTQCTQLYEPIMYYNTVDCYPYNGHGHPVHSITTNNGSWIKSLLPFTCTKMVNGESSSSIYPSIHPSLVLSIQWWQLWAIVSWRICNCKVIPKRLHTHTYSGDWWWWIDTFGRITLLLLLCTIFHCTIWLAWWCCKRKLNKLQHWSSDVCSNGFYNNYTCEILVAQQSQQR